MTLDMHNIKPFGYKYLMQRYLIMTHTTDNLERRFQPFKLGIDTSLTGLWDKKIDSRGHNSVLYLSLLTALTTISDKLMFWRYFKVY